MNFETFLEYFDSALRAADRERSQGNFCLPAAPDFNEELFANNNEPVVDV